MKTYKIIIIALIAASLSSCTEKEYKKAKDEYAQLSASVTEKKHYVDSLRAHFVPEIKAYTIEHTCKIMNAFGTFTQSTFVVKLNKELTEAKVIDQKNLSFTEK